MSENAELVIKYKYNNKLSNLIETKWRDPTPQETVDAAMPLITGEQLLAEVKRRLAEKHNTKTTMVAVKYYIHPHGHCYASIVPDDLSVRTPPEKGE